MSARRTSNPPPAPTPSQAKAGLKALTQSQRDAVLAPLDIANSLATLKTEGSFYKIGIIGLTTALFALVGFSIAAYLRLDDKIDRIDDRQTIASEAVSSAVERRLELRMNNLEVRMDETVRNTHQSDRIIGGGPEPSQQNSIINARPVPSSKE